MEKLLLKAIPLFLLTAGFLKANAQELQFTYDAAGNQIERNFVCINCTTYPQAFASAPLPQDATTATTAPNKTKSTVSRKITAYPNPVSQTLNLKWDNGQTYYVYRIEAYSSKGITIYKQDFKNWEVLSQNETIPFDKQVPGMYFIRALYSDGKQEIIKVIKIDK